MKLRFTFFLLIFLTFLCTTAHAISVTPAKHEIDFVPSKSFQFDFKVRNNAGFPVEARISLGGDLAQYATLSTTAIADIEDWQDFHVTLDLPESVEKPGKNILKVTVVESFKPGNGMVAKTAVVPWIIVNVPYPGKYAEVGSFVVAEGKNGVNEGEDTPFSFSIRNRGKEDITAATATVSLLDNEDVLLDSVTFQNIFVGAEQDYKNIGMFTTSNLAPNDYKAKLVFKYPDQELLSEKKFLVGHFNVTLLSYTKELSQDGIMPFDMRVKSLWKSPSYVEAKLKLHDLPQITTPRERLEGFASLKLRNFVDTNQLPLGTINGSITLLFSKSGKDGTFIQNTYPITVDVIPKSSVPATSEEAKPTSKSTTSPLVIVLVVLLLLLLVNGFVLMKVWKKK